jgi:hypothetical protein
MELRRDLHDALPVTFLHWKGIPPVRAKSLGELHRKRLAALDVIAYAK